MPGASPQYLLTRSIRVRGMVKRQSSRSAMARLAMNTFRVVAAIWETSHKLVQKKVFFYLIKFFINWLTKTLTFRVCLRHLRNNIPVSSFGCNAKLKGKLVELADIFFLPHCQHNLHSCHFNICSYVWIPKNVILTPSYTNDRQIKSQRWVSTNARGFKLVPNTLVYTT